MRICSFLLSFVNSQLTKSSEMKAKKFQSNLGTSDAVDSSRLKKLACDVLAWTFDEIQLLMHGQLKVRRTRLTGEKSMEFGFTKACKRKNTSLS